MWGTWAHHLSGNSRAFPLPPQLVGGWPLLISEAVFTANYDKS